MVKTKDRKTLGTQPTSTTNSLQSSGHCTPASRMAVRFSKLPWKNLASVSTDRQAAPPRSYACAICGRTGGGARRHTSAAGGATPGGRQAGRQAGRLAGRLSPGCTSTLHRAHLDWVEVGLDHTLGGRGLLDLRTAAGRQEQGGAQL